MELQEAVRRRKMVRNFEDRPVPPEIVDRLLDNGRRAPSAGHTQGYAFLVLEGAEQVGHFWDCTFPADKRGGFTYPGLLRAPLIIVPCSSKEAYLDRYAEPDKGWADRDEGRWPVPYWDVDCAFGAMSILLTATDAGLGALFFGIFGGLPELRQEFGIPETFRPIGAIAVGYPQPDTPSPSLQRGRRAWEESVHRGHW